MIGKPTDNKRQRVSSFPVRRSIIVIYNANRCLCRVRQNGPSEKNRYTHLGRPRPQALRRQAATHFDKWVLFPGPSPAHWRRPFFALLSPHPQRPCFGIAGRSDLHQNWPFQPVFQPSGQSFRPVSRPYAPHTAKARTILESQVLGLQRGQDRSHNVDIAEVGSIKLLGRFKGAGGPAGAVELRTTLAANTEHRSWRGRCRRRKGQAR